MSLSRLPSGRWRAQVWDPRLGRNVSVSRVLGGEGTFRTKGEAKAARERARAALGRSHVTEVTVSDFWERWTTDPLFQRPKASTNVHNAERTRDFAKRHANVPLRLVTDQAVGEWLAGGKRNGTVPALRAMFNDAMSPKAGRLIDRNPFAKLGISRGPGRRYQQPPAEGTVRDLIRAARDLSGPSFAGWLQVAAFTGMRPGELDALRWDRVDFEAGSIQVTEQWSQASRQFTLPKNGLTREAILTPAAREALLGLAQESDFCFVSLRGGHWTAPARAYHWKAIRAQVGYTGSLYLATRHFAGWYMRNVLRQDSEDVAVALGHTDGGELVRTLYGHLDADAARGRIRAAYEARSNVVPLRRVDAEGGAS